MPTPASAPISGVSAAPARRPWLIAAALAAAVGLAALNMRTAISSVGAVLPEVQSGLGMSGSLAGLLTSLPLATYALFGAATPWLARRTGEHTLMLAALAALALGLWGRAAASGPWGFLAMSAVTLMGGAVANVALPGLIKRHFPDRIGAMTALYTTAMAVGTVVPAAATVPLALEAGWRFALGVWALPAVVGALPWLALLRRQPRGGGSAGLGLRALARSRLAWLAAVFFGCQAMLAFIMFGWYARLLRDAGLDAPAAGVQLALLAGLGVPLALVLPGLAARMRTQRPLLAVLAGCYLAGFLGLLAAPVAGVWAWTVLIGTGLGTFTVALTLFALRARTPEGTAALSAFAQSTGYLIATVGPLLVGLLHDHAGGAAPVVLMIAVTCVLVAAGWAVARPRFLEDELAA
ncbi:MFS transporter [Allonocardiopsis opalescens]|uniref:CP family cyanate transporter-like MFS transporter n=1 Tax=Allonocardiopsis opalescens TaxID=1144618 RepID=A0A2T0Q4J4_9ACTN|nr:MFS transporter [Allonocardiopsis opalescens]PRX98714.1 CP family cyanate transporter-like MFS transporter [Allonocardiopsis opalescens]